MLAFYVLDFFFSMSPASKVEPLFCVTPQRGRGIIFVVFASILLGGDARSERKTRIYIPELPPAEQVSELSQQFMKLFF